VNRRRLLTPLLGVGVVVVGTLGVTFARSAAQGQCEERMPPFPARVTHVSVDWRLADVGYDCVYRMYHGKTLRVP
jgi:hypothetical protein